MAPDLKQLAESFGSNLTHTDEVHRIQAEDGSRPAEGKSEAAAGHMTTDMVDDLKAQIADSDLEVIHEEPSVVRHDLWVVVA